jgi:mRNA interferase RelE/StbE
MQYTARLLESAIRDLRNLDLPVRRRLANRIQWLAEHFEEITPQPLHGSLAGLFKLREGDHRIIYEPIRSERVLVIHAIGHRREIYYKGKS